MIASHSGISKLFDNKISKRQSLQWAAVWFGFGGVASQSAIESRSMAITAAAPLPPLMGRREPIRAHAGRSHRRLRNDTEEMLLSADFERNASSQ